MIQRNRFGDKSGDIMQNILEGVYLPEWLKPDVYEGFEEVPGRYDVGDIVRGYSQVWLATPPVNHATPAEMLDLLLFLDDITMEIEAADIEARQMSVPGSPEHTVTRPCRSPGTPPGIRQLCIDVARWRKELDEYLLVVGSVPLEKKDDRNTILWEVTAPLFLGWYGGLTGDEVQLVKDSHPPGFNTEFRHVPGIAAPYTLANQFDVYVEWEDERRRRLHDDLKKDPTPAGSRLLLYGAIAAVGYGGWRLLTRR